MIWPKPIFEETQKNIVEVPTQRIIKLYKPPFSTKNAILDVPIGKPNTLVYLDKTGTVVEMTIDSDQVLFSVKPDRENTVNMHLIG